MNNFIELNADHIRQMGDLLVEPSPMLSTMVLYTLVGSALGFQCYNSALNFVPAPAKYASDKKFKWRNVMTSFVHALISGSIAVYCIVQYPELRHDLVHSTARPAEFVIALSCGYFVYDGMDLLLFGTLQSSWPLLLHHSIVLGTFLYLLYYTYCTPCAVLALLVEVNSIFLHGRQLLLMAGVDKSSMVFLLVNLANILTYVVLRFGLIMFFYAFIYVNWSLLHQNLVRSMVLLLFIMAVINIILFWRLLKSDVFPSKKSKKGEKELLVGN